MSNVLKTKQLVFKLRALEVDEVIVCAGARNAPLVVGLESSRWFRRHAFFEERDAGFFALGRAKASARAVAVVTTSGTAAAELLPAAIEAHYSGVPLILVTADRPHEYRGTGAPQAIEQAHLFGCYVETFVDWVESDLPKFHWRKQGPLHLNVALGEPTTAELDEIKNLNWSKVQDEWGAKNSPSNRSGAGPKATGEAKALSEIEIHTAAEANEIWTDFFKRATRPLVVTGPMSSRESLLARTWLEREQPILLSESLSNLGPIENLKCRLIRSPDFSITEALRRGQIDSVIRLGGIPTNRLWRDLEERHRQLPVIHVSEREFSGLARPSSPVMSLASLSDQQLPDHRLPDHRLKGEAVHDWIEFDQRIFANRLAMIRNHPRSELGLLRGLAERIGEHAKIFLGNSLPIREWDQVFPEAKGDWLFDGHRGANGIDGQISGFLGFADSGFSNWGIFGDLTALYNLSAPWALSSLGSQNWDLNIVIINNGGGRIFARMHDEPLLQNEHQLDFSSFARFWKMDYLPIREISEWERVDPIARGPRLIEVFTDETESRITQKKWQQLAELK